MPYQCVAGIPYQCVIDRESIRLCAAFTNKTFFFGMEIPSTFSGQHTSSSSRTGTETIVFNTGTRTGAIYKENYQVLELVIIL